MCNTNKPTNQPKVNRRRKRELFRSEEERQISERRLLALSLKPSKAVVARAPSCAPNF